MVSATLALTLLKVTLAAALGLLAVRLATHRAAALRHAVLLTTFVALAAIPVVTGVAPSYLVSVEYGPWPSDAAIVDAELADSREATGSPSTARQGGWTWPTLLVVAWASGAALTLLPAFGALLLTQRLRRGGRLWATALTDAPWIGLRRPRGVDVVLHADVSGPTTCGLVRPFILLPDDARRWPREDLNRALVHELAHISRADVLVHALARGVCAAYWFHPLVWACWRRLRQEAERACDDAVVARFEPTAYARQLLVLARRQQGQWSAARTAMADRAELAVRIHAILDRSQARQRLGRRQATVIAMLAIAGVAALAPLTPVRSAARVHGPSDLTFSSASVLRSRADEAMSMRLLPDGRLRITGASLRRVLRLAYGLQDQAIVGAPAWMNADRFDITATAPPGSTPDAVRQMLRTLLQQRFALRAEHDVQKRPVFVLARTRTSGTELRPSRGCQSDVQSVPAPAPAASAMARPPCGFEAGPGRLEGTGIDLHALAATLSTRLERAVMVDEPAYARFDFVLMWNTAAADPVAALTEALDRQLGLAVVSEQRDLPVLVIRSARPAV